MADRRRFRFATVRVRTTIGATAVVGLALVLGSVALVGVLRTSLRDNVQTAELRAEDVASRIEGGGELGELAVDDEDDSLVQVLDRSGVVVAASTDVDGEGPIVSMRAGDSRTLSKVPVSEHDPYLAVARRAGDGRYLVIVARTLEPVRESTEVVVRLLLLGIPALLGARGRHDVDRHRTGAAAGRRDPAPSLDDHERRPRPARSRACWRR